MNIDVQVFKYVKVYKKFFFGKDLIQGKGFGGDLEVGYCVVEVSVYEIVEIIGDVDLVFIMVGMGNGIGIGVVFVVVRVIKECVCYNGCFREFFVISVVIYLFKNEGKIREEKVKVGIKVFLYYLDIVVIIENDKFFQFVFKFLINVVFCFVDEIIVRMVKGIIEIIKFLFMVNIDFVDVYSIMYNGGVVFIGIGESDLSNRVVDVVKNVFQNKFFDVEYGSGEKVFVYFIVGFDVSFGEINEVMNIVYEKFGEKSEIKWGVRIDEDMGKMVCVMVIMIGVKSLYIFGGEIVFQFLVKEFLFLVELKVGFNFFEDKIYKVIFCKFDEKLGSDMRGYINKFLVDFDDFS